MKNTRIMIMLLIFGMTLSGQSGSVEVDITDIVAEWGGSVKVGLFVEKGFPKTGKALENKDIPVRDIKAQIKFENIPVGKYAIAVFQDVNVDSTLNRTIYGQPTEPYAFSNNVFGRFGPPKFSEACFSVEDNTKAAMVIHLRE